MVFSINGRRILSQFDYDQALIDAAMYRGGLVSLTVRNIRFDYGQSFQEFVNVSTVLPGYGGVYQLLASRQVPWPLDWLADNGKDKLGNDKDK